MWLDVALYGVSIGRWVWCIGDGGARINSNISRMQPVVICSCACFLRYNCTYNWLLDVDADGHNVVLQWERAGGVPEFEVSRILSFYLYITRRSCSITIHQLVQNKWSADEILSFLLFSE